MFAYSVMYTNVPHVGAFFWTHTYTRVAVIGFSLSVCRRHFNKDIISPTKNEYIKFINAGRQEKKPLFFQIFEFSRAFSCVCLQTNFEFEKCGIFKLFNTI